MTMSLIPTAPRSNSTIVIPNDDQQQHQQLQQDNGMIVPINDDYYPTPYDILLGKEKAIFNHSGNKRFRAIINSQIKSYIDAPTKSAKTKLIHQIHNDIRKSGYRFLKKRDDNNEESNLWDEVDRQGAREKVSHALRDRVKGLVKNTRKRHERGEIIVSSSSDNNTVSNSTIRKILQEELNGSGSINKLQQQQINREAGAMSILFQMNNRSENRLHHHLPRQVTSDIYDSAATCNKNNGDALSSAFSFTKNSKKRRLSLLDTVAATANMIHNNNNNQNNNSFSAAGIFADSLLPPSNKSLIDTSRESSSKRRRLSLLGISDMFNPIKASRRNGLKLGGVAEQLLMGNNNSKKMKTAPKRRLSLLCLQQRNLIDSIGNDDTQSSSSNNDKFQAESLSPFSIEETIRRFSLLQKGNNNSDENNAIDNEIITWNLSQRSRRRLSMLGFLEEKQPHNKEDEEKNENDHNDSLDSSSTKNNSSSSWRPVSMFGLFGNDQNSDDDSDAAVDDDEDEAGNSLSLSRPNKERLFRQKQQQKFRRRRSSMSTLFFGDDDEGNIESEDNEPLDNSIELNEAYLDDLFSCGGSNQQQ